jgi:hypothetical protein
MDADRSVKFAVQRQDAKIGDWHTIRHSITPHVARARRIMTWKRGLATQCKFRLVSIETTITPVDDEAQE